MSERRERRQQSVEELALTRSMLTEGSMNNIIAYSSISADATAYDQQYTRLKSFVAKDSELEKVLFPLCVHMYLELLSNGQKTPAHKFLSRQAKDFIGQASQQSILQELNQLQTKVDIANNATIMQFKNHKYSISLSEAAINQLQSFLKNDDNVLLLQMFHNHIDINVQVGCAGGVVAVQERALEGAEPVSRPCTPENKVIQDEVTLSSLQACMRRLRDAPPALPSIALYTGLNTFQGMCCATFSPEEKLLATGFEDSAVRVWSLTADHIRHRNTHNNSMVDFCKMRDKDLEVDENEVVSSEMVTLRAHSGSVYGTTFLDKQYLLSASEDTTVRLWDLETCSNRVIYRGHTYPVWGVDASPLGQQFATCSHDRTGKLWCTDRTYPLRSLIGHLSDVDVIQFHPNGSYVCTGGGDRTVRLWAGQEGRTVRLFQGHRGSVLALAFSPNGQLLASAGEDRRIRVWDLNSGCVVHELRGHTDTVGALAFSRGGGVLASGAMDATVRVWDVRRDRATSSAATTAVNEGAHSSSSPELMAVYPTKAASVHHLRYSCKNFLLAAANIQP